MVDTSKYLIPNNLFYSKAHQWVKIEGDIAKVGITDHAQNELGDITLVSLMAENLKGKHVTQVKFEGNDPMNDPIPDISIESAKTIADIYAPVSGEIIEIHEKLEDAPDKINQDPYGEGWLFKIKTTNFEMEKKDLLDAPSYKKYLNEL